MEASAVKLQGVTHVYITAKGASLAIEDIHFTLRPGEFVSLVGPSGCGKTTLLSLIAGLIQPTEGTIEIGGQRVDRPSVKVGYMLQNDYLFPWRTIEENVLIGLELTGQMNVEKMAYSMQLLADMGLAAVKNDYPHQLSGGMRQRSAFVRTLTTNPQLLLLDEPFSALDYQTKLQLEDLLATTIKAHRKTALLVTHDISEAIAMSDRILILDRNPGRIRKEMIIPERIRHKTPFKAREEPDFQTIFREIWEELQCLERKDGE